MCGITGIYSFNEIGRVYAINLQKSMETLKNRGPDQRGTFLRERLSLGHTRLSIIDISANAKQPMSDSTDNYHLIFNGEIYNYQDLKDRLAHKYAFKSQSDTEVLLYHLIENGAQGISELNGFFSFAFFNEKDNELLLARDRYGIKPLYYFSDNDKFLFGSELRTVNAYNTGQNEIDPFSIWAYLQLNYLPGPFSLYKNIKKLLPGQFMIVSKSKGLEISSFYKLPVSIEDKESDISYDDACLKTRELLEESVRKRLISDVPLGAFLSGGVDSSIITGLAKQYKTDLNTFSVGFPDHSYFDESEYSEAVAKHFGTNHHSVDIRDGELLEILEKCLEYYSEPFADSSSIAYYALCQKAKKELTVCLSGDGADELFGGYMKHQAWQMISSGNWKVLLAKIFNPLMSVIPESRDGKIANFNRRIRKLAYNSGLNSAERYFEMCRISSMQEAFSFLHPDIQSQLSGDFNHKLSSSLGLRQNPENLNQVLFNDLKLVLSNDMLVKADQSSMANSLEVRVPFLDHKLVNFVSTLPSNWKADTKRRKKLLVDSFRGFIPDQIINRPKKGFEVPLEHWMKNELKSELQRTVFSQSFIEDSRILNWNRLKELETKLYSRNPGDSAAKIWALYFLIKKIN